MVKVITFELALSRPQNIALYFLSTQFLSGILLAFFYSWFYVLFFSLTNVRVERGHTLQYSSQLVLVAFVLLGQPALPPQVAA